MVNSNAHGTEGSSAPSLFRTTFSANQILNLLPRDALDAMAGGMDAVELRRGQCLFEPGDEVTQAHFPLDSTVVALVVPMRDGRTVEATTIGREGAIGGTVSRGHQRAFTRAVVHIPGNAVRISLKNLEAAKRAVPDVHDLLSRYEDCLMAQVLQSVGCAAVHPLEARCARWLLLMHDRLRQPDLPLTQEMLADMFGATRTYVTRIASSLQKRGAIVSRRGIIHIESRELLEETTCECYGLVRQHFERVQPGLYPAGEP
ncbi:MAG TPA: Crp/Fnr family transcriptional regulator [Rhizomicrobium sp.]|nr:Crp/Fnr family transcriptional regulator [Rhizomicrobium sp.]